MTIKAAGSAIIDDLVDSGSFLRRQVSMFDYGVLDNTSGCAIVLQPSNSTFEIIGYGGVTQDLWGIVAECYVRDTGIVSETLTRVWDIIDAVKGAVSGGLNGNSGDRTTKVSTITRTSNVFVEFGGNDFIPVYVTISVQEDPC